MGITIFEINKRSPAKAFAFYANVVAFPYRDESSAPSKGGESSRAGDEKIKKKFSRCNLDRSPTKYYYFNFLFERKLVAVWVFKEMSRKTPHNRWPLKETNRILILYHILLENQIKRLLLFLKIWYTNSNKSKSNYE